MDIKARYPHASFLPGQRVVFNIRGGNFRLDARIDYGRGLVVVVRVGTHKEYEDWQF